MNSLFKTFLAGLAASIALGCNKADRSSGNSTSVPLKALPPKTEAKPFVSLFPEEGVPTGWVIRNWEDIKNPVAESVTWKVENGVLHGSAERGNWLMSEKEYADFILEFEWKLGERGNSGFAFRSPMQGDPAFDGFELQMVDPRYYRNATADAKELTGSLYKALAPLVQVFKPVEWNKYEITCKGPMIKVVLNGETILDVNLDEQTAPLKRHDGSPAPALKDRPRKGHIGFQELSRGSKQVEIRNARMHLLD